MLIIPEKLAVASLVKYGLYGPVLVNYAVLFFIFSVVSFFIIELVDLRIKTQIKWSSKNGHNEPPLSIVVVNTISKIIKLFLFASVATCLLLIGYCYEGVVVAVSGVPHDFYEPIISSATCAEILNGKMGTFELTKLIYGTSGFGLLMVCAGIITTSTSLYIHLSNIFYEGNYRIIYLQPEEDDITKVLLGLPLACIAGSGIAAFLFVGYASHVAERILC